MCSSCLDEQRCRTGSSAPTACSVTSPRPLVSRALGEGLAVISLAAHGLPCASCSAPCSRPGDDGRPLVNARLNAPKVRVSRPRYRPPPPPTAPPPAFWRAVRSWHFPRGAPLGRVDYFILYTLYFTAGTFSRRSSRIGRLLYTLYFILYTLHFTAGTFSTRSSRTGRRAC